MRREDLYVRSALSNTGFDDFIESLGGNLQDLLQASGLDMNPFGSRVHFESWAAHCNFLEYAAEQLNEPYLGMKWAFDMPKDYRTSGPTILIASMASDLRHFLDMAVNYQKIHTNGVKYSYQDSVETNEIIGTVAMHPLSPSCRQLCEHIMAGISIMGQRYIKDFKFKRATFQYSEPDNLEIYEKAFKCSLEFNAPQNTLTCDRHYFQLDHTKLMTKLFTPIVKVYLNHQLKHFPHAKYSVSETLFETLPSIIGIRKSDIETVSEVLAIHPKKLQRLLKDEGTSYSEVLDQVRQHLAERLLIETDISIMRVAKMLDYSADRPFTAAMRRWHGTTPTKYRKAAREESSSRL